MDDSWVKCLLLICCGLLMLSQPILALRIKRADNGTVKAVSEVLNKPQVEIIVPIAASNASAVPVPVLATAAVLQPQKKLELQEELPMSHDLAERMYRAKRRLSPLPKDESVLPKSVHHAAYPAHVAAPPLVYYNKMISPDGKQEVKEFQLLAPNMVIESLQRDMNYGPVPEMGGVLLLNADSRMQGLSKPKHHHRHKPSLALPPFLYMLQQMLQPNLNLDMEMPQSPRHTDTPIYQFLDNAVDNALHNNHELMDRVLDNHYHDEIMEKDKETKDHEEDANELSLQKIELSKEDKAKDELLVSCPIHHEHHANANGDAIDDDVVLVNECHIV
ncbi:uncharacterized protein LOC117571201 [Drosophila albomicans]|uniref:Uncharacterized protein LOC117571201 n=1 Tax=Drosophila albomicans TaxID=7291 RepID=A0A6P8YTZ5_DROAB|nr:uncharacterized protein LOC117571201 [Drosophila albomicans]